MPPIVFGRYVLEEPLAVGGMGEVFLATDRGSAGAHPAYEKVCVVKRILPQLCDQAEMVAMFTREAAFAALLGHQNITQVYDHGICEGRHYLALEYVRGVNLKTLLDAQRTTGTLLPVDDALFIITQVAQALDHAHRATARDGTPLQIVHRDVSPQNVLLSSEGEVKLTDFGMVKGAAVRGMYQTQETTLKGKVAYLSPEQASGQAVDARSDLFSLGVLLYETLCLAHPFSDGGVTGVALLDRIRRVSFVPPQERRADLPPAVVDVINRCLVAEPADRIGSAREVLDALDRACTPHRAMAQLAARVKALQRPLPPPGAGTRESALPVVARQATPARATQEARRPVALEEQWQAQAPVLDDDVDAVAAALRLGRRRAAVAAGVCVLMTAGATWWLARQVPAAPTPAPEPAAAVDAGATRAEPSDQPRRRPPPRSVRAPEIDRQALLEALPTYEPPPAVDAGPSR